MQWFEFALSPIVSSLSSIVLPVWQVETLPILEKRRCLGGTKSKDREQAWSSISGVLTAYELEASGWFYNFIPFLQSTRTHLC